MASVSLQDVFRGFDLDKDGRLSRLELEHVLKQFQADLSATDLERIFARFDRDGSGHIDISEFQRELHRAATQTPQQTQTQGQGLVARISTALARSGSTPQALFASVDTNRDGKLSYQEIHGMLQKFQPDLTLADMQNLFRSFDKDGSGQVDATEFAAALQQPNPGNDTDVVSRLAAAIQRMNIRVEAPQAQQASLAAPPGTAAPRAEEVIARIAGAMQRMNTTPASLFGRLDANKDGRLSYHELQGMLQRFQPDLSQAELQAVFYRFDRDGSGQIDIAEFQRALQVQPSPAAQHEAAPRVEEVIARIATALQRMNASPDTLFGRVDANKDGRLSYPELQSLLQQFQPDLTQAELQALFTRFDADRSGQVDVAEFQRALLQPPPVQPQNAPRVEDVVARIAAALRRTNASPEALFQRIDVNRDGRLSYQELQGMLHQFQPDLTQGELQAVFYRFDKDRSGQVDVAEFQRALLQPPPVQPQSAPRVEDVVVRIAAALRRTNASPEALFQRIDVNKDGRLSYQELQGMLHQFQPDLTQAELQAVFYRFDRDGSGQIDVAEFQRALTQAPPPPAQPHAVPRVSEIIARLAAALQRMNTSPDALFSRIDVNRDGHLSYNELQGMLHQFQPDLSQAELQALFYRFDRDGSGQIDTSEFQRALLEPSLTHFEEIIARISAALSRARASPDALFARVDVNRDGRLSYQELNSMLQQFQSGLSPAELQAVFKRFDRDGSGQVDIAEFRRELQPAFRQQEDLIARIAAALSRASASPEALFARVDVNRDGRLSYQELQGMLQQFQPDLSPGDFQALFRRFDRDGSGQIDVAEFRAALEQHRTVVPSMAAVGIRNKDVDAVVGRLAASVVRLNIRPEDLFARLDVNRDQKLSRTELERALLQFEADLSVADLQLLFKIFDRDGSGAVDAFEFSRTLERAVRKMKVGQIREQSKVQEARSLARRQRRKAEVPRPQLYIIGEIEAAVACWPMWSLYCTWRLVFDAAKWWAIQGETHGETIVSGASPQGYCVWNHPIMTHLAFRALEGWPRLELTVRGADWHGRERLAGYGVVPLPTRPGPFRLRCRCWRPAGKGLFGRLRAQLLGVVPEMQPPMTIADASKSRPELETEESVTVVLCLNMVHQHFRENRLEIS